MTDQNDVEPPSEDGDSKDDGCYGPLGENCEACEDFKKCIKFFRWYVKIPHFIICWYFRDLKPTEFKVFVFLSSRADFRKVEQSQR